MNVGRCVTAPVRFQMAFMMTETQQADSKVLEFCFASGYSLQQFMPLNAIPTFSDPARDE